MSSSNKNKKKKNILLFIVLLKLDINIICEYLKIILKDKKLYLENMME